MKIEYLHTILISVLFYCFTINGVIAQSKNYKQPLAVITYNKNVNAPLTIIELNQLKEVYGDKLQQYVLNIPQRVNDIKNILRNRVKIITITNPKKQKGYKLLSQVSLFKAYNKNLTREVFSAQNFNPLKYNFNFFSRGILMYSVDNTDYFVIIKSQHQK